MWEVLGEGGRGCDVQGWGCNGGVGCDVQGVGWGGTLQVTDVYEFDHITSCNGEGGWRSHDGSCQAGPRPHEQPKPSYEVQVSMPPPL